LNNGYLGLIRQASKYNFEMDYEVQTWYEALTEGEKVELPRMPACEREGGVALAVSAKGRIEPENQGRGFDFVKFAEACGATGERVTDPKQIQAALRRAVASGVPYVIDVIIERETDASMGVAIDAIREFE
jgi:tartronate-semialdehyde synthase